MPIYEYRCARCGRRTEAFQKMNEPPLATCEFCGGALRKMISPPAIHFKGNGWYVTDYARKSSPSKEENPDKEGPGKPASGGKSEAPKASTSEKE
jgi:putative FmdB family regulatory protein